MPESDPEDIPVTMSAERSMVIVPDASAKRPVPPVMGGFANRHGWKYDNVTVSHQSHANLVSIRCCPHGGSSRIASGHDHGEVGTEGKLPEMRSAARTVEMPDGARVVSRDDMFRRLQRTLER